MHQPRPIQHDRRDTFTLNRFSILTQDKNLVLGMPCLYSEGSHIAAVRLLVVWQEDGIVYLTLQELQTNKSYTVNWNLDYSGSYYLWTIADLPTLMNLNKGKVF